MTFHFQFFTVIIPEKVCSHLVHLDDNDQEKGHIPRKVDLMDLEHRRSEAKDQSSNDDLDRLEEKRRH